MHSELETPSSESVLAAVRSLGAVAAEIGDVASENLACELAEQIPRETLNLIVAGQFKRGKSSLVNALLRADLMPTGALPLTGVATAIRYGDVPSVTIRVRGEQQFRRIEPEELAMYVTERFNPANTLGIENVDVRWPSELLRGIALFDTPGVGSVFEHNTAAALAALPRADAAMLVLGPEPPVSLEELEYAREVVASSEKLFAVLNKSDLAGEALTEVLDFTRDVLSRALSCDLEVLPVSATRARDAQRVGREDPEFARLAATLRSFIEEHGFETRSASLRRRALRILERLDNLASLRLATLRLPAEERRHRRESLEKATLVVDDRARPLQLALDDDVRRLQLRLEDRLDRMYDRDLPSFRAYAEVLSRAPRDAREKLLEERLDAVVSSWRAEARALADVELRACSEKYARLAADIERSVWKAGLEAGRLEAGTMAPTEFAFAPPNLKLIASLMPTTGLEVLIGFAIEALPGSLRRVTLRRRYDRLLAADLDAARGKLLYGISRDLEPWRRDVHQRITSSLSHTRAVLLAAFEEPAVDLGDEPSRGIENIRQRLRDLRARVSSVPTSQAAL